MTERFSAVVGASIKDFLAKMREVHSALKKTATGANADIGANVRAFNAKMTLVRANLKQVEYAKSEAKISADISAFNRTMAVLKAKMLAISGSKVVVQVKSDWNSFREGWQAGQQMMGKIATSMRNFGEIVSTSLQGAFIAVLPAISPIIANLGGLIGSLGPVIGTVAGSTFALVGAFAAAGSAAAAFGAVAIPTIKRLFEKNAKLTSEQKKAKSAFDVMKSTYNGLVKATEKPVLSAFTTAMHTVNFLLKELKPLFISSARAVDGLMKSLNKSMGTPPVQKFLNYLNKDGAKMLTRFGQAFGNVFSGLASMLTAFAPLSASTAKGFLGMTKSFADWAAGLGKSKKFKKFMDYVQTNMPKLKSIFGDAIIGVVNIFAAFGPMSSNMMSSLQRMMGSFREWSASLSKNEGFKKFCDYVAQTAPSIMALIGNLTTFLINLGVGMAPLGAKILELTNRFLSWTDNMMKTHPVIGQIIAVAISLMGVVMAVLPWILSVGSAFLTMLRPGTTANNLLLKIGQVIGKIIGPVINLASKALPWLVRGFSLLTGPVAAVIAIITSLITVGVLLYKNWDTIKEYALVVWSSISTFFATTWESIKSVTQSIWTSIKDFLSTTWASIKSGAMTIWDGVTQKWIAVVSSVQTIFTPMVSFFAGIWASVYTGFSTAWTKIQNLLQTIWNAIKTVATSSWIIIKNVILGPMLLLIDLLSGNFEGFKSHLSQIWNNIKAAAATAWTAIKEAVSKIVKTFVDSVRTSFEVLKQKATIIWTAMKTAAVAKFTELKTAAVNKVKELASSAINKFGELKQKSVEKVQALKTSAINKFSDLKTSAVNKVKELTVNAISKFVELKSRASSKVSEMKTAVADKFRDMVSSVKEKMDDVKSKVESGWNKAKSFLEGIDLTSIGGHIIQGLINGIKNKAGEVIAAAKSIADKVTSTIKKALDIHSPSRVTYALGGYTGQGFANGIQSKSKTVTKSARSVAAAAKKAFNDGMRGLDLKLQAGSITTDSYVKQAKALGNKYKSVTNAQNVVAAKIQKATTSQALKAQRERHAKQIALQKQFNNKYANLNNKYASNDLSSKQYISKLNDLKKTYKNVTNVTSKIDAKIAATKKSMLSDDMSKLSMLYSDGDLSTKQYLKKLESLKKTYKGVKGAVVKIDKEYNKVRFEDDKQTAEKILANGKLTADQQVKRIIDLSKKYKKDTEQRIYFEQQAAEKKKAIYEGLIALNDEYTSLIQEANQKLKDGEKALNEEYNKAVADRANTIKNFVGIFDEIPEAAEVSGQQLKSNLQSQVETIRTWSENMASLASKGIDKGLLAELQAMGPGAASQIAAMNTLSDTELQEYVALWQEKSTLATQIATNELVDMRVQTDAQIAQLRKETQAQLKAYNSEWLTQIKDLTGKTSKKFNALTASMPAIGKNVIKGMQRGLSDMTPDLIKQAEAISESVKATIQKAFDIHSPSRWGKNFIGKNLVLGMINGINNMQSKAVSTALELADEVKAGMAAGLTQKDVLGYTANATSSINKELNVKVKVELEGDGNNGKGNTTVNQEVHLHSPRELSPSENARQMKKQAQKLAQEWG